MVIAGSSLASALLLVAVLITAYDLFGKLGIQARYEEVLTNSFSNTVFKLCHCSMNHCWKKEDLLGFNLGANTNCTSSQIRKPMTMSEALHNIEKFNLKTISVVIYYISVYTIF
jgi:hypothetical protein